MSWDYDEVSFRLKLIPCQKIEFQDNFARYLPIRTLVRRSYSGPKGELSFKNTFARFLNDAGTSPALLSDSLSSDGTAMPVRSLVREINRQMITLANNFLFS